MAKHRRLANGLFYALLHPRRFYNAFAAKATAHAVVMVAPVSRGLWSAI
jgi:hypothetical protein